MIGGHLYKSVEKVGDKLLIEFEPASLGSGLIASDKGLSDFEIAGADKVYIAAQAMIIDNKVVVSNSSLVSPLYVRYALERRCHGKSI